MSHFENYVASAEPFQTGLTRTDQEAAINSFHEFLELPEYAKRELWYPGDPTKRNTSAGYVCKDDANDRKSVFHYTEELDGFIGNRILPKETENFLRVARNLYRIAATGTRQYLESIAVDNTLRDIHFPKNEPPNHHLRFVAYHNTSESAAMAEPHYDKSTLTAALCESHPGLRLGKTPEDLDLYDRDPSETLIFHGRGWLKLHELLGRSTDRLPAWHDVVAGWAADTKSQIARTAIVLFANPAGLNTAPTKRETKNHISELELGNLEDRGVLRATIAA